jgi:hypothetical protein
MYTLYQNNWKTLLQIVRLLLCAYSLLWKHVLSSNCIAMDVSQTLDSTILNFRHRVIISLFQNLQLYYTYSPKNYFLQQQCTAPIALSTFGSTIQMMFVESFAVYLLHTWSPTYNRLPF